MRVRRHKTAGGVVLDADGRVLVIVRDVARDGRVVHEVRLPKGHIDPGETDEAAAMREVGEESGYTGVAIAADLGHAHSTFDFRGKHHERDEHYFLMRLTSTERGTPQPSGKEEALFEPDWIGLEEAAAQLTYASEREFVGRARAYVGDA